MRGFSSSSANRFTSNPAGAVGSLPGGQATMRELLATPRVAYGGGRTTLSPGPLSMTRAGSAAIVGVTELKIREAAKNAKGTTKKPTDRGECETLSDGFGMAKKIDELLEA